jgi:hypothetical protein
MPTRLRVRAMLAKAPAPPPDPQLRSTPYTTTQEVPVSHRREPPPLAPGAARSFTLKVVCGDASQHPAIVLHHLADMRGHHDCPHAFRALEGRNELRVRTAEDGTVLYCFRCPRCLKTPHPVPERRDL